MSAPQDKSPPSTSETSAKDGPGHSDIFDRLNASSETDLVGLVAYGLYQRRKRCWIRDFQTKNGRYPTQDERDFYSFGYRDDAVVALKREAEGVMGVRANMKPNNRPGADATATSAAPLSVTLFGPLTAPNRQ